MKAIIAIDSFKGSMDSLEAGLAAGEGIQAAYPEAETLVYPLADGGEGTVQALVNGLGGKLEKVAVTGPLGELVECEYGILANDAGAATAIIEMAGAAGITLLKPEQRNPLYTTTYGVGEVIKDAIAKGCRKFIVGIGGSATNDCGIGMLQALGAEFLDEGGKQVPFGAAGVEKIAFIDTNKMLPELDGCQFRIACDVDNPLYGEKGCSHIFGPQKGATPEMVEEMDGWIKRFAGLTAEYFAQSDNSLSKSNQNALMKTGNGIFKFVIIKFTTIVPQTVIRILKKIRIKHALSHPSLHSPVPTIPAVVQQAVLALPSVHFFTASWNQESALCWKKLK